MDIDLNIACDRIEMFAREGRLSGGQWHGERDGREIACIYGSIDPIINSVDDCPASLGPLWLHKTVIKLFDGLADDKTRNAYGLLYAQALRKTAGWSPERWENVCVDFLCLTIDQALNWTKAVAETTNYWPAVYATGQRVKLALRGDGDLSSARAAAWAVVDVATAANYTAYAANAAANATNSADYAANATAYDAGRAAYAAGVNVDAAYAVLFGGLIGLLSA